MTTLWLVRHASTSWTGRRYSGVSDPHLDAVGRRTAAALAANIAPILEPGTRVVSSPLTRARATAEVIAGPARIESIEFDDRWREADMGIAEGRTFDEVAAIDPTLARRLAAGETAIDWPGGDTAAAIEARVSEALAAIRGDGRPTVVVSHAGPLRLAIARINGTDPSLVKFPESGTATRLEI